MQLFNYKYAIMLLEGTNMDEYTEKRFSYLRELTRDEQLNMIQDLEEEIEELNNNIKDKSIVGEQKAEMHSDLSYALTKLNYLNYIINEKSL